MKKYVLTEQKKNRFEKKLNKIEEHGKKLRLEKEKFKNEIFWEIYKWTDEGKNQNVKSIEDLRIKQYFNQLSERCHFA